MSEALLERQMDRMAQQVEGATIREAKATARLEQAGDLLTALGVPLSTDPDSEGRTGGIMEAMTRATPRRLTFTERIMWLSSLRQDNARLVDLGGDQATDPA